VLVSSHVLSEVQQTVDDVVIISQGRLVHSGTLDALESSTTTRVIVRTPTPDVLAAALRADGRPAVVVEQTDAGALAVSGLATDEIGHVAFATGVELHELRGESGDLERVFLELTASGNPGGAL
jgi:ABC-2 type transport system ATP-binding protein